MARPKLQSLFAHSPVLRYGLADASSAIALGLALLSQHYGFRNVDARLVVSEKQQVAMNLIINGIDVMKDVDGTREIAIASQRAENEQLQVSISDTGIGLPSQRADQIFNAFFTTKPQGTGMGLRISRSIVESHGGRLWAAQNSPRGTCFAFTLPTKLEGDE